MTPDDFNFENISKILEAMEDDNRSNSLKFLKWFLLNIVGLDEIGSVDAICDGGNDKGIDGLFIDHDNEQIIFIQSKLKQNDDKQIGDAEIRGFSGSIQLFDSEEKVQKILEGTPNKELSNILETNKVDELIKNGYNLKGYFVTNSTANSHAEESAGVAGNISIYDRVSLSKIFIEPATGGGVTGKKVFKYDAEPLEYQASTNVKQITFMAKANDLITLDGIQDNTLFDINVRYPLGNTKVNKGIKKSVENNKEHSLFALFHNGVIILCDELQVDKDTSEITIKNYAVVNGAQSIKQLYLNADNLTDDLHVLTRVIDAKIMSKLASNITERTNTQNGVRPRDKRSNDLIQSRIAGEFVELDLGYAYEIKRGAETDKIVITNEKAGKLLITFDLMESFSTHQLSNIFETRYHDIFARPIVDASRIIGIDAIYSEVENACSGLKNKSFGSYAQTKYLILQTLSQIFKDEVGEHNLFKDISEIVTNGEIEILRFVSKEILDDLIIDLNHEEQNVLEEFNFKSDLKNRKFCNDLMGSLIKDRMKDVKKGKAYSVEKLIASFYS